MRTKLLLAISAIVMSLAACSQSAGELKNAPVPSFIAADPLASAASAAIPARAEASTDQTGPGQESLAFMYRIQIPPITRFEVKSSYDRGSYRVFGDDITIERTEDPDGTYTYSGESSRIALEILYSPEEEKYSYVLVTRVEAPQETGIDMEYYIVASGEDIALQENGRWDGKTEAYIQIRQPAGASTQFTFSRTLSLFHSDELVTGICIYGNSYNNTQLTDLCGSFDSRSVSVETGEAFRNELKAAGGWSNPSEYYELVYFQPAENKYGLCFPSDDNGNQQNPDSAREDVIEEAQKLSSKWVVTEEQMKLDAAL